MADYPYICTDYTWDMASFIITPEERNKVNAHSGLRGLLWVVIAALFAFTSCSKDLLEDIVYPDRDYFGWTLEFEVNGE